MEAAEVLVKQVKMLNKLAASQAVEVLSLIHISEPTRPERIS